jgi:hypothetical protein
MVNAVGVEERTSSLDSMHFITLFQEKFSEISTILTGNPGD